MPNPPDTEAVELKDRLNSMISLWALNGSEFPSDLAGGILAVPEIADALTRTPPVGDVEAVARAIYQADGKFAGSGSQSLTERYEHLATAAIAAMNRGEPGY